MKRVYVNEEWCLGCHLCEYNCAFAATGETDMAKALQGVEIHPKVQIEGDGRISFAVSCRHCDDPICMKSCIAGAISKRDGVVHVDKDKCVGCYTCVLVCPYGAVLPAPDGHAIRKCELCTDNACGEPACVKGCPNGAIVFEER